MKWSLPSFSFFLSLFFSLSGYSPLELPFLVPPQTDLPFIPFSVENLDDLTPPLSPQHTVEDLASERSDPSLTPLSRRIILPSDHSGAPYDLPLHEPLATATSEPDETNFLVQADEGEQSRPSPKITGSFTNVSIIEFINFLGRISGRNFIYDEADLQFDVTVITTEEEPVENLLAILLQQLQAHNLSLSEQGNTILIHRNPGVRSPGEIVVQGERQEAASEIVTKIFRLNTLDPNKISEIIRPMLSTQALVLVLRDSNHIIITDILANVDKISELVEYLDAPIGGMEIGQYVSENSVASSLILTAQQILEPLAQGNPFYLVPYEPTNSVFIISNPFLVARAISILGYLDTSQGRTRIIQLEALRRRAGLEGETEPLDREEARRQEEEERRQRLLDQGWRVGPNGVLIPPGATISPQARATAGLPSEHIARTLFFIYKLQYRNGDQILQALKQIAGVLNVAGNVNPDLVSAINSIQWIESTNSLIFTGTAEALDRIKDLLEEIDIPLRQVFIEVLILDTTITDALTYSVDWGSRFGGGDWAGGQTFLRAGSPLPAALQTAGIGLTPTADSLARTQGFNLGIIGQNITKMGMRFNSIGALVTAIHTDQFSDMIMNPKIITEDNHTAELFVGQEDRFRTQTISNEQNQILASNFETVEIGTTIRITPLLGPNDIITLEIEEENTSEAPTANAALTQSETDIFLLPIATKSKTTTRVHVPDKYFVILSGMTTDNQQRSENRVPCLGGFPVIGTVFRQKNNQDRKRNLMIFIRPEIIDTEEDYRRITQRNQDIFKEKDKFKRRWTYEYDEALEWVHLKETQPNESCYPYKSADCPVYCPTK